MVYGIALKQSIDRLQVTMYTAVPQAILVRLSLQWLSVIQSSYITKSIFA